jgi:hypothetical protein
VACYSQSEVATGVSQEERKYQSGGHVAELVVRCSLVGFVAVAFGKKLK